MTNLKQPEYGPASGASLSQANTAVAERQAKADTVLFAIDRLDQVTERLVILLSKIREGDTHKEGSLSCDRSSPTLQILLNNGPEQLGHLHDQMMSLLDEIEAELF